MNRKIVTVLLTVMFVLSGLLVIPSDSDDSSAAASKGTIVVESSPDFAPYDYYYGAKWAGIDMDIMRAIGNDTGYTIEFKQNTFDSIILSVTQGKSDMGASGFTISEERKKSVDFSDSYAVIKQVIVAKAGLENVITSYEWLKDKTVAVQSGTSGADYADSHVNDKMSQIHYNSTYTTNILDIINDKADCEIVDDAVAAAQVAAYPGQLQVYNVLSDAEPEYYGFIFAKGSSWYSIVNDSLKKLKADGTVDKILSYYAEHGYSTDTPPYYNDNNGTITVESSPDFAPYDYYYGTKWAGIDMDILRAIGADINYTIDFKQNNFDSIILSVTQGKSDMGASGFTISEERKKSVDFTDSYAVIKQVIVAKKGLENVITSPDYLKDTSVSVAVQTGTSGADYAVGHVSSEFDQIHYLTQYASIVLELTTGLANCEIVDDSVAAAQVAAHPDELQVYDVLTDAEPEYYGFVFAKGSALYETVNESLKRLKDNGTVAKITQYYADHGYSPDTPSYYDQVDTLFVLTDGTAPNGYTVDNQWAGVDLDIMRAVADKIGYQISFVKSDFDSIFDKVIATPSYVGAAAVSITSEREEVVSFSVPYLESHLAVIVPEGSSITTTDDLKNATIGVLSSSTALTYCDDRGYKSTSYPDGSALMIALKAGSFDCVIIDDINAKSMCSDNKGYKVLDILTDSDTFHYGFVFSQDAGALQEKVDAALTELISDGTVGKIISYYEQNGYSSKTISYYAEPAKEKNFFEELWDKFYNDFIHNERYQYIFHGLQNTIEITIFALIIGIAIGTLAAAVMGMHAVDGRFKILNGICKLYVTVIRGTPMMVQLLIIYYVVFASVNLNQILIASIAFGLNSGAYVAEVIRSGINSVPKGQMEAARSLGLNPTTSMFHIIVPQAIRNILPALGNEGISLLKETSIAGYIGVLDLTRGADIIRGQTYDALLPLLVVAMIYLAIVLVMQYLISRLEKRLNNAY